MKKKFSPFLLVLLFSFALSSCAPIKVVDKEKEAEAHFILGISYMQEQDPTRALKEFLIAEEFAPSRVDIQEGMAQAYQLKQVFSKAEEHYLKAMKLAPNDARIANNLGSLYLDMEEWDKAIKFFEQANVNLLFNDPEMALTGIGYAYFRKTDYEKSALYYKKALKKKWNFAPAYFRLGELYQTQGKSELARHSFQKTLDFEPNWALPYFHLGLIQVEMEEIQQARDSFRNAVKLAPKTELADKAADLLKTLPESD